jgi:hypothetical protein
MKKTYHQADTRGHVNFGWLDSYHTFSFGSYFNEERIQFGKLRVLNDDIVEPSKGFDTHPHQDMEIVSIPLAGSLKHKDSMGNEHIIPAGDIQIMSAGSGITHSEYNHSDTEVVNFLQIWILPNQKNLNPSYGQKSFDKKDRDNSWQLIVSPTGEKNSLKINQKAYFSLIDLSKGLESSYSLYNPSNQVYFFAIEGELEINDQVIHQRDGLGIEEVEKVNIKSMSDSKLLAIEVS